MVVLCCALYDTRFDGMLESTRFFWLEDGREYVKCVCIVCIKERSGIKCGCGCLTEDITTCGGRSFSPTLPVLAVLMLRFNLLAVSMAAMVAAIYFMMSDQ
eukprot:1939017-Ditylum_brightwellii.AAC.2